MIISYTRAPGRRKLADHPVSFYWMMFLLSTSRAVFGSTCHGPPHLCRFGLKLISDMNIYNQFFEEFRNGRHHITKRTVALDFETKKDHDTYETDVVDREDHVTQYLSELLVNTDSEITSLQGTDVEPREEFIADSSPDRYFLYLTEEEGVQEVDNALSIPARTIVEESETYQWP